MSPTAAKLLRLRGDAMQNAVPVGEGAMAALLGVDLSKVEELLASRTWSALDIANDNAPGQVVISGSLADVDAALALAKENGIRKAVKLPVSAPFHCRLMAPAVMRWQRRWHRQRCIRPVCLYIVMSQRRRK